MIHFLLVCNDKNGLLVEKLNMLLFKRPVIILAAWRRQVLYLSSIYSCERCGSSLFVFSKKKKKGKKVWRSRVEVGLSFPVDFIKWINACIKQIKQYF